MTVDAKAVRALVAEEAAKQPLLIQLVPRKLEPGEALIAALFNWGIAGALLMFGLRAGHEVLQVVPAAGYLDSLFVIGGANAVGAALGWTKVGVVR
jgi:hypothetical protein